MPELIQQKKYELSNRTQEIISLATAVNDDTIDVERRIYKTKEAALECGRLLLEEQAHVLKTLGKGSWESYFDIMFSKVIARTTSFEWMKKYKQSITRKAELPVTENQPVKLEIVPESPKNNLRESILLLKLMPAKKHEAAERSGPIVATPKLSNHLSFVNKFIAWHTEFMDANDGHLTLEQRASFLRDFSPIANFVDYLRGT